MSTSNVDRIHAQLRRMAADFRIKPETRINEGELAGELGVSRTPLREALNRLVAEGFLTFRGGHGFFCRSLTPKLIMEWYEARGAIELEGLRLALLRASDAQIHALLRRYEATEAEYFSSADTVRLLELDETFHSSLLELAGNPQLCRMLDTIHGHIRYVRLMNLKALRADGPASPIHDSDKADHRRILSLLRQRDDAEVQRALRHHIELRLDDATKAVSVAYSQIYMQNL